MKKDKKEANAREREISLVTLSFLKKGLVTAILVISVLAMERITKMWMWIND